MKIQNICSRIGFIQGRLSPQVNGRIQAFPWEHWQEEFKLAKERGFSFMEWTLDHDRLGENPLMHSAGRSQITKLCECYDIKIPSLTGDFIMQMPFFKKSGTEREYLFGLFLEVVDACRQQGIGKLVFPLVDQGRIENAQQQEILTTYLSRAEAELIKNRVTVCFESDMPPDAICEFINRLPGTAFAINYDIGNSASLGYDYKMEINSYGSRVANIHIKDRLFHGPSVPLGQGQADIKGVIKLFEKIGYQGLYILQTARSAEERHVEILCHYRDIIRSYLEN